MLKIKDNVDLSELEKFGFEKTIMPRTMRKYDDDDNLILVDYEVVYYSKETIIQTYNTEVNSSITVSEEGRQILKQGMITTHFAKELVYKYVEETLFDLIEAGLVERV